MPTLLFSRRVQRRTERLSLARAELTEDAVRLVRVRPAPNSVSNHAAAFDYCEKHDDFGEPVESHEEAFTRIVL